MKVMVVEDEPRLGNLLRQSLTEHGFTVHLACNCQDANDGLAESHQDVIVLDLGLPDGDGLTLIREWRQSGFNEPVLILSARDRLDDRIKGLNLGADDYLPKPFSIDELVARIRAIIRRQTAIRKTVLERGVLRLDLLGRTVSVKGDPVDLTGREYALLEVFMHNAGRILPRSMISERIWSSDFDVEKNLLDVYMSRLRIKLETAAGKPLFKTVRGIGYQLL